MYNPTVEEFFNNYIVMNHGRGIVRSSLSHAGRGSQYKAVERALVELYFPEEYKIIRSWQLTADEIKLDNSEINFNEENVIEFDTSRSILDPYSITLRPGVPVKEEWSNAVCCCSESKISYEECKYCGCDVSNYVMKEAINITYVSPGTPLGNNQYTIIGGPSTWGAGGTRVKMKICPSKCYDHTAEGLYVVYARGPQAIVSSKQKLYIHWEYLHVLADFVAYRLGIRAQNYRSGDEVTYRTLAYAQMKSLDQWYKILEDGRIFKQQKNADVMLSNGGSAAAQSIMNHLSR